MTAPTTPESAAEARPVEVLITRAQAQILVEIGRAAAEACGLPYGPSDEVAALRAEVAALRAEVERLRGALIAAGRHAKCYLDERVSTDFLMYVPDEIKANMASLATAEATLSQARQILTDAGCDQSSLVDGVRFLVEERGRLREALRPFAYVGESFPFQPGTNERRERNKQQAIVWSYHESATCTDYRLVTNDFRRARSALANGGQHGD